MPITAYTNIHLLVGVAKESNLLRGNTLKEVSILENAYLLVNGECINGYGTMQHFEASNYLPENIIDVNGASVLPCWCDSHTHCVFAASREDEFVQKINGASYQQIAANGGGILNSAKRIAAASEDELYFNAVRRIEQLIMLGTGAIEIKSGYGLSVEAELKMLRVIKRLKENMPIPIKATFLGAHAFPLLYKEDRTGYIQLIVQEMLPKIAAEQLADFIDVFCENGFFTEAETVQICNAGLQYGLQPKIHANQLSLSGGVQAGVAVGAISVDHLETMDEASVQLLANSHTIGTLLPTAALFLRMQMPPARQLIQANAAIALASDYNPGSSPSGNMNLVVALSCIQMKMLPEEAINAATINGAFAMQLQHKVGSITVGKQANLIFTKPISSLAYLPYAFGENNIDEVMINGAFFKPSLSFV